MNRPLSFYVAEAEQGGVETPSNALLDVPPSADIAALEAAAESLTRLGDLPNAIAVWAVILRMREEIKCPVT